MSPAPEKTTIETPSKETVQVEGTWTSDPDPESGAFAFLGEGDDGTIYLGIGDAKTGWIGGIPISLESLCELEPALRDWLYGDKDFDPYEDDHLYLEDLHEEG